MSLVVARAQINKNSTYCTTLIGFLPLLALHFCSIYYWGSYLSLWRLNSV